MNKENLDRANRITKELSFLDKISKGLEQNQGFHKVEINQLRVVLTNGLSSSSELGQQMIDICVNALESHIAQQTEKLNKEFNSL